MGRGPHPVGPGRQHARAPTLAHGWTTDLTTNRVAEAPCHTRGRGAGLSGCGGRGRGTLGLPRGGTRPWAWGAARRPEVAGFDGAGCARIYPRRSRKPPPHVASHFSIPGSLLSGREEG